MSGSISSRIKRYAKQVAVHKIDEKLKDSSAVSTLSKLPNIPVVTPMVKKVAKKAKQHYITDTDVLIIGAGLSGIAMASKLSAARPYDRFTILERRKEAGGTWDLFKYPGIRSDSDVTTFGFANRPWKDNHVFAKGQQIKDYIIDAANEADVFKNIEFEKSMEHLSWSDADGYWTATVKDMATGKTTSLTAKFVVGATGYYDYKKGYQPDFANQEDFEGLWIHPQQWAEDTEYHDKKVVVIGSGATAVTLIPALLEEGNEQQASHVTMLQRSPSYIASLPGYDDLIDKLSKKWKLMPEKQAYSLVRWRNIMMQQGSYRFAKKAPTVMKFLLKHGVKKELKGSKVGFNNFNPSYNPWDQRLCAVPDGDFFEALRSGKADVVTDSIDKITKTGILLKSGKHLDADIIVCATGLNVQMLGGSTVSVNGDEGNIADKMTYKAVMVEEAPNLAVLFGYTNASWTLKIDLATDYIVRMLNHMSKKGYKVVTPHAQVDGEQVTRLEDTVMGSMSSGYIQRAKDVLPKQGDRYPWYVTNNYLTDRKMLLSDKLVDKWLEFTK